jgi:hypothetical protein
MNSAPARGSEDVFSTAKGERLLVEGGYSKRKRRKHKQRIGFEDKRRSVLPEGKRFALLVN